MAEEAKEFTPITTQEEFNARVSDRIQRVENKYSDYNDLKTKAAQWADYDDVKAKADKYDTDIAELTKQLNEAKARVAGYESHSVKQRIAREVGIPLEMADRLNGDTEEALRKDAESLKPLIGNTSVRTLPLHDNNDVGLDKDPVKNAWKRFIANEQAKEGKY